MTRSISAVALIVYCFCLLAHGETVVDVLSSRDFGDSSVFFCQLSDGKKAKNINNDVTELMTVLGKSSVTEKTAVEPIFAIYIENGSSFSFQAIKIIVSASGNGIVEYLDKRVAFFNCPELPAFCTNAFNRSKITVYGPDGRFPGL